MRRVCFLAVVLFATIIATASAQDFRGGITGRITDSSGGRLPGVTVTATNVATKVASSTTTNGEGDYTILYLTPGVYSLTAELSGFNDVTSDLLIANPQITMEIDRDQASALGVTPEQIETALYNAYG